MEKAAHGIKDTLETQEMGGYKVVTVRKVERTERRRRGLGCRERKSEQLEEKAPLDPERQASATGNGRSALLDGPAAHGRRRMEDTGHVSYEDTANNPFMGSWSTPEAKMCFPNKKPISTSPKTPHRCPQDI